MIENIGQIKQRAAKVVLAVLLLSSLQVAQNQNAFADPYVTGLDTLKIKDGPGTGFEINLDTTTATMTAEVSYETNTVTIWPAFTAPTDSVTIKTIEVSTVDSITATLSVGSNTFSIIAFQAGVEVPSTLTITRANPDLRISFDPAGYLSTYDSVTARAGGGTTLVSLIHKFPSLTDTVTALSLSQVETITVGGVGFGSGNGWVFEGLAIGVSNDFDVVTQAKVIGGDDPIYETTTVKLQVPSLSNLTSTGTLSPAFSSFTKSYTVSVANTVTSITFTPTTELGIWVDTITVNGESVASTEASSPISLAIGSNTILIVVNASDLITSSDTFTVTVTRAAPPSSGGGGGGGSSGSSAPVLKTQGVLSIASPITTIEYGNSFKISVSGGSSTGAIKYSSIGTALCSITSEGLVTAVGKGSCVITATKEADSVYAATSASITITVTDQTVAGTVTEAPSIPIQTMNISAPVAGVTTAKVKVGADYSGQKVSVLLGTKVNGKTTYKTLGSTTVGSTGYVTYKSKVKLPKGSVLRLKSGSEVIFTRTIS
jgi:hypothetical protein